MSSASAWTRRVLAIIIMTSISIGGLYCIYEPQKEFITFNIPENRDGVSYAFGLIKFSSTKESTISLTTGHLALMFFNIGAMTAGFYFTPSGKR